MVASQPSNQGDSQMVMTKADAIRPFSFKAPEADLADLRKRIKATKWAEREQVADDSQGVQLDTIQKLARYWAIEHDWRKVEARLNALPNFITEIDGLDIHFLHVRSKHENALPMIVTHGWPGSVIEQLKIIDPLTNPTANGGSAADAFDLVIPSMPGYGFSGKPTAPGWNPVSIAKAWATLMQRLGYTKYVAQGGDWGAIISEVMALQQPPGLLGIHTNMAATVPPDVSRALAVGGPAPAGLSPEEKHAWDQLDDFYKNGLGYALEMNNRPQTLYGIADSPVGLAAWMIDHDIRSYRMIARVFDGKPEGLTRDDILDNVTLYWLTNTAISSARLYWDTRHNLPAGGFFDVRGIKIPVAVSAFAEEIYQAPKSWAEKAYPKLIHYNRFPKGTHFAAWEQPKQFVEEMRTAFKSLRKTT
jgi:pimeloyl-ACP methyl ester carboxylesterase